MLKYVTINYKVYVCILYASGGHKRGYIGWNNGRSALSVERKEGIVHLY
jgi:hypothetical protein